MAAVFIIAHAPLASALQAVAAHAFPERTGDVGALDITPDMADAEGTLRAAVERWGGRDVLMLADAFGATPCNLAQKMAQHNPRIRVVAGVNVPMLWRVLCYAESSLDDLVGRAIVGANQGVLHVTCTPRQNQPSPPPSDDQVQRHDQQ